MNITEEDFTQAISKIESDTDVHLKINKKNFYAFYRYTSYNIEINGTKILLYLLSKQLLIHIR